MALFLATIAFFFCKEVIISVTLIQETFMVKQNFFKILCMYQGHSKEKITLNVIYDSCNCYFG